MEERVLITHDLSLGKVIHTQRNNVEFPISTCNTTSYAMAFKYRGLVDMQAIADKGVQLEDDLTHFTQHDPRVLEFYKRNFPKTFAAWQKDPLGKNVTPPNQMHLVLAYAMNLYIGKQVTEFRTDVHMNRIIFNLKNNQPVIASGIWAGLRHIVCVVGFKSYQTDIMRVETPEEVDLRLMDSLIIDDPYGNYKLSYRGPEGMQGNGIEVPYQDFVNIVHTQGSVVNKMVHLIA